MESDSCNILCRSFDKSIVLSRQSFSFLSRRFHTQRSNLSRKCLCSSVQTIISLSFHGYSLCSRISNVKEKELLSENQVAYKHSAEYSRDISGKRRRKCMSSVLYADRTEVNRENIKSGLCGTHHT